MKKSLLQNNKLNNSFLFFVIIIFLFSNCRKKIEENNCIDIPPSKSEFGYDYQINYAFYLDYPEIVKDSNQILFYKASDPNETNSGSIYVYDINKNISTYIFSSKIISSISLRKNWILYSDNNIWKIKTNGDSLTQITFSGFCDNPLWINDTSFIFKDNSLQKYLFYSNDTLVDTLINCPGITKPTINNNNLILSNVYSGIQVYDMMEDEVLLEFQSYYELPSFSGAEWISNNEFIWATSKGIYITNILNYKTKIIKEICNNTIYSSPTYDSFNESVYWRKIKKTMIETNTIKIESNICKISLNDYVERESIIVESSLIY